MSGEKQKVQLSDGRFYYRCTLKDLSFTGFTACDLPMHYDDKVVAEVSLILSSNRSLKMSVVVHSIQSYYERQKKDIVFRIIDPPVFWKTYIEDV